MCIQRPEGNISLNPQEQLENAIIEEYLRQVGLSLKRLHDLPEAQAKQIMEAASLYASVRLSEVETRARLVHKVHGIAPPLV